ncbi:hypothetical protein FPSE_02716 [Fusarium pseudograminearum CS3096]|uniref:Uncharacterized protein n=1 Tax=Fusarium pseudograminearum (strain CS3096) TaxID=1028729 RepID=K3VP87_FUSPC|nr:hypothetical protein FPSE_02716 [Fusarium pseudograminearum CS3096]EKJ77072.1 hypothetical protein FPSE_02716 [Fusarium pseudograminearum CS3096]
MQRILPSVLTFLLCAVVLACTRTKRYLRCCRLERLLGLGVKKNSERAHTKKR